MNALSCLGFTFNLIIDRDWIGGMTAGLKTLPLVCGAAGFDGQNVCVC
jgi:hypothetical protein